MQQVFWFLIVSVAGLSGGKARESQCGDCTYPNSLLNASVSSQHHSPFFIFGYGCGGISIAALQPEVVCANCSLSCAGCFGLTESKADVCLYCGIAATTNSSGGESTITNTSDLSSLIESESNGTFGYFFRNSSLSVMVCCGQGCYIGEDGSCRDCEDGADDQGFVLPTSVIVMLGCGGAVVLLVCVLCSCLCYFQYRHRYSKGSVMSDEWSRDESFKKTSTGLPSVVAVIEERMSKETRSTMDSDNPLYMQSVSLSKLTPQPIAESPLSHEPIAESPLEATPTESPDYIKMMSADINLRKSNSLAVGNRGSDLYCTVTAEQRRAISFESNQLRRKERLVACGVAVLGGDAVDGGHSISGDDPNRLSRSFKGSVEVDNQYIPVMTSLQPSALTNK